MIHTKQQVKGERRRFWTLLCVFVLLFTLSYGRNLTKNLFDSYVSSTRNADLMRARFFVDTICWPLTILCGVLLPLQAVRADVQFGRRVCTFFLLWGAVAFFLPPLPAIAYMQRMATAFRPLRYHIMERLQPQHFLRSALLIAMAWVPSPPKTGRVGTVKCSRFKSWFTVFAIVYAIMIVLDCSRNFLLRTFGGYAYAYLFDLRDYLYLFCCFIVVFGGTLLPIYAVRTGVQPQRCHRRASLVLGVLALVLPTLSAIPFLLKVDPLIVPLYQYTIAAWRSCHAFGPVMLIALGRLPEDELPATTTAQL